MRVPQFKVAMGPDLPAIAYDGRQLAAHWLRQRFDIQGDAAVFFRGPCRVDIDQLVDLEDKEQGAFIAANDMLHLILEMFDVDLGRMVLIQRVITAIVAAKVRAELPVGSQSQVRRSGDDVYVGAGKLTVSIATVSPVSSLIHMGINVTNEGTPVETAALSPLGIDPYSFARTLAEAISDELQSVIIAMTKVLPAHPLGPSNDLSASRNQRNLS